MPNFNLIQWPASIHLALCCSQELDGFMYSDVAFRKLRHQITNGWSIIRTLRPTLAEELPHVVVQPTLDDAVVYGADRSFTVTLLENHLDTFSDVLVWHLVCKQLNEFQYTAIKHKITSGPTSRMVIPKLYISPLADTAACISNISGALHLQLSDWLTVWVIKLPSSYKGAIESYIRCRTD